jgi:Flp pilus assembly protein TadD
MPSRTYMVVDPRRDHSFRVPRPDLSAALGTPNVCTDCHRERAPKWAADRIAAWRGSGRPPASGFAPALDAARRGLAEAGPALARLAGDRSQPGIARATAVAHLGEFLTAGAAPALIAGLRDPDPLIRMAAARAAEALPAERRGPLVAPLLRDPVRAVRLAAAHALAGVSVPEAQRGDLDRGITEWVRAEQVNADRPEAHVNLAGLYARTGRTGDAESALRTALRLDPRFVPALVNLADLLRAQGRDTDGERMLEQALRAHPEHPEALHALGLLRVRQRQLPEAVDLLRRAAASRPESSRFAYVYAVSLHDTGRAADAIGVLETAHRRRPADREVLAGLASYLAERGDIRRALEHAEKLVALDPDDVTGRRLVEALRGRTGGR